MKSTRPPQKGVAIVGWSGLGRFENLERTASTKLSSKPIALLGRSLLFSGKDPVEISRRLGLMPGVGWIAVGHSFRSMGQYTRTLEALARRYLSKSNGFKLFADVIGRGASVGDVVLAGNSAVLAAVPGSKVRDRAPDVTFRVTFSDRAGACGVQIRNGPRGVPTGDEWVACMVSGGYHSSAMAWMAALSGFSIRLVHSRSDERSLVQVAKLYAELSRRIDATRLELVVLDGSSSTGGPSGRLGAWLERSEVPTFAGLHPERSSTVVDTVRTFPKLLIPLFLVQDEEIRQVHNSLGLRDLSAPDGGLEGLGRKSAYEETFFGHREADSNEVIDAVRRRALVR